MINRMEAGSETGGDRNQGVPGVTGQANPGAAMHGNTQQVTGTTPPQGLVGTAGTLVGSGASASAPSVLPPPQSVFGMYGPVRGGFADPISSHLKSTFTRLKKGFGPGAETQSLFLALSAFSDSTLELVLNLTITNYHLFNQLANCFSQWRSLQGRPKYWSRIWQSNMRTKPGS